MLPPTNPDDLGHFADRLIDNGWVPVPVSYGFKTPVLGIPWSKRVSRGSTFTKIAKRLGLVGVGLRLDDIVVIDIDSDDPAEVARIEILAESILGSTPLVRMGREPRRQLFYRAGSDIEIWREHGRVECLTGPAAYVVGYNLHPDTRRPYVWIGEASPVDYLREKLPSVSAEAVMAFKGAVLRRPITQSSGFSDFQRKGRTVCSASGVLRDGRDAHLRDIVAKAIGRAKADMRPLNRHSIISRAWAEFARTSDLSRPKGRDGAIWSLADVERKVDYALRPGRSARINALQAKGFWTFARKCLLKDIMQADRRLKAAALQVGWTMIQAVRNENGLSYLASATIAGKTGLHEVTVRKARRQLLDLSYFEEVRAGGQNRPTICRPNRGLIETAQMPSQAIVQQVSDTFPVPSPANGNSQTYLLERSQEWADTVVCSPTEILTTGGGGDAVSLGQWVQEQRDRLGLSQSGLARRINCSPSHVADVEAGRDQFNEAARRRLLELARKAS